MSLQGKPLEAITDADLQALIDNQVREGQTLEYKRDLYGRGDEEVREMLRNISSIANAFGGDLLIGVDENEEGIAVNLPGVENAEVEAQRVVGSSLANIEERVLGLRAWPVRLQNGRSVVIVRIPRSLRAPHMVTFKGLNQFWARHDRQKAPMSTHEIKDVCLRVEGLMEELGRFLEKRKREILKDIFWAPYYVVAVTPIFANSEVLEIGDTRLRYLLENPMGQRQEGWNVIFEDHPHPTLNGLIMEIPNRKALELFRTGHMELRVRIDEVSFCRGRVEIEERQYPVLYACPLVEYPVSLLRLGKAIYDYLGLTDPIVVSVLLYNIDEFALHRGVDEGQRMTPNPYYGPRILRKKHLYIPPRQTPSLDEPDKVAKMCVDRLWQAFGYEQAPLFDTEGNFRPK